MSPAGRPAAGRLALAWLVAFGVIHVRGDGRFPFPASWSLDAILAVILVLTLAFHGAVLAWLRESLWPRAGGLPLPGPRLRLAGGLALVLGCVGLHAFQARRFGPMGYALAWDHLALAGLGASAVLAAASWRGRLRGRGLVLAAAGAALVLKLLPLVDFPVDARRSDLLPILRDAGAELAEGREAYRYYRLENGVDTPNVRLPGLMLAYAPAAAAEVDLRWVTLLAEALVVCLLVGATLPDDDADGWYPLLLAAFLLMPYFHTRHELYEPPLWVPLVACVLACDRGWWGAAGASIGVAAASHQWGFLLAPQVALLAWRRDGLGAAARATAIGLLLGAAIFVPLVLPELEGFRHHVIEIYAEMISGDRPIFPYSLYLSPVLARLGWRAALPTLQGLVALGVLALAARGPTRMSFRCVLLALAVVGHLLFNALAWTYQLLLPLLLVVLATHYLERELAAGSEGSAEGAGAPPA